MTDLTDLPPEASPPREPVPTLGHGCYTHAEAACYVGLASQRVRLWFLGRRGNQAVPPVFRSDDPPVDGLHVLHFVNLVELAVAVRLRGHGVSLQAVRAWIEDLAEILDSDHPLARGEVAAAVGFGDDPELLAPFGYDPRTRLANFWRIAPGVVLNPHRRFGEPLVERVGITTRVLADAFEAEGRDAGRAAACYGVEPADVRAAVEFEALLDRRRMRLR